MTRAFIFPGQGSQYIGMGKLLYETFPDARAVFEEIDESLGQNLSSLMFEGAESDLNLTENTQPALMAVSMAVMAVLEKQGELKLAQKTAYVAGHSLGEYAALTAAGTLKLSDTAKLLKLRGQSMQKAVPLGQGSMAAILGLSLEEVQAIAAAASNHEICEAANDNSVGQVVVSGHKGAVAVAIQMAQEKGAKRAIELPVSAPFHCRLMAPAAEIMQEALAETNFAPPAVPVVCNVTAQAESDPECLRDLLVQQITGMVRWRESVIWMHQIGDVSEMIEIGAGKVLTGLIRRIEKDILCENIETPEQIEALIERLN